MGTRRAVSSFTLLLILVSSQLAAGNLGASGKSTPPTDIGTQGTTPLPPSSSGMGGLEAPGANALMTPDLLLVNPNNGEGSAPPQPLKAYIGTSVTLSVERYDIAFDRLSGILITVVNDTNRPLVVNGEHATAVAGGKTYPAARVAVLQQQIVPPHRGEQVLEDILRDVVPAAATVGAAPTIRDITIERKPVLDRYGPDETRRRVESTRFGRRVLWPHQKTRGILYFDTQDNLNHAKLEIPTSTLFDMTDAGSLSNSP
jgi:hypothetical protein